jgi:hypothetical protein
MRFLLIHHDDPLSEKVWAGTALQITRALQSAGHQVAVIDNLRPGATLGTRLKGLLARRLQRKIFNVNRDPDVARLRARYATEARNAFEKKLNWDAIVGHIVAVTKDARGAASNSSL